MAGACGVALGLQVPQTPAGRVSDYASVLSRAQRYTLEERLARFERETTTQIAVAVFPGLEGENLEDFCNRLFSAWGLGRKDRNNGALIAVFMADRKVRIEAGYGLEGVLTDALAARIIREEMAPEFRSSRPFEGLVRAVGAIERATRGEYTATSGAGGRQGDGPAATVVVIVVLLAVAAALVVFQRARAAGMAARTMTSRGMRRARRRGGLAGMLGGPFGGDWGGGWSGGSGGGFGGGGGFSGGGGMSGGGGASGGW